MQAKKLVRMSSKGQIVVPKRLREKMGLQEGDYIVIQERKDGSFTIRKQAEDWLDSITKGLREEAKAIGFTRKDLADAIREVRRKRRA